MLSEVARRSIRSSTAFAGGRLRGGVPSRQVWHELLVLERLHQNSEFSPGASLEALTRPPLAHH